MRSRLGQGCVTRTGKKGHQMDTMATFRSAVSFEATEIGKKPVIQHRRTAELPVKRP